MPAVSMSLQGNRKVMEFAPTGAGSVRQSAHVFMKVANRRCGSKQGLISGPDLPCGSGHGASEFTLGRILGGLALWKDKEAA